MKCASSYGAINVVDINRSASGKTSSGLIKIGAKLLKHSRYVVFQMAEVAVPMALFRTTILKNVVFCACFLKQASVTCVISACYEASFQGQLLAFCFSPDSQESTCNSLVAADGQSPRPRREILDRIKRLRASPEFTRAG